MKAIVLIGGFGTRLRPVTYQVPKQLIPIAGKPMLYHVLDLLPKDLEEAIFASGYLQDVIAEQVARDPPSVPVRCVPEATPLGTGGGMRNAGDDASDPFLLVNSDVIAGIDVPGLVRFHRARGGVGAMSMSEVEDTRPYGVMALGAEDRIERFVEKPEPSEAPSHWINAGVSIWRRSVLERIPRGRPVSFEREIVPGLLTEGIYGYRCEGFWEDAGTPERLLRAQRFLFDSGRAAVHGVATGTRVEGAVSILPGAATDGALLGPYVHVGRDVRIGRGARVANAILMDGAAVGAGAVVEDSLLGPRAVVPDGAVVRGEVRGVGG